MSEEAMYEPSGNGTEVGMLKFLQSNDYEIHNLLLKREKDCIIETNIPFGPIRKRQVVALRPSLHHGFVRIVVKGAPEYVMPMCSRYMDIYGKSPELDSSSRD